MKEIPLTQGKVALVDDEDFPVINSYKWFAHYSKRCGHWYAERNIPNGRGGRKPLGMHRQILGVGDDHEVDHKDRNGLNNQRHNIRQCIRTFNQGNTKVRVDSTSGKKGVNFRAEKGVWRARIQFQKKRIHIGDFYSPEEAAAAYNKAALQYFGEFARINEP